MCMVIPANNPRARPTKSYLYFLLTYGIKLMDKIIKGTKIMNNKLWVRDLWIAIAKSLSLVIIYTIAETTISISGKIAPNTAPNLNSFLLVKLASKSPDKRCIPPCTDVIKTD